jgi:hypothetical protein
MNLKFHVTLNCDEKTALNEIIGRGNQNALNFQKSHDPP